MTLKFTYTDFFCQTAFLKMVPSGVTYSNLHFCSYFPPRSLWVLVRK